MNKKTKKIIIILILFFAIFAIISFRKNAGEKEKFGISNIKEIRLNDDGLILDVSSQAETINDFLAEQKIELREGDIILPGLDEKIFPHSQIIIWREKKVSILADKNEREVNTWQNTVIGAIAENDIFLGEDDLVYPGKLFPVSGGMKIEITRVKIEEQLVKKDIAFKTITEDDDNLSWRTKKIKQKGEKGIEEIKYKVVSHNGQEISRKILERKTTKEPVTEVAIQGTYMKLGKAAKGDASHYAKSWGELNASRSIPRGGFAKVTNLDNGKSVVVKINDYGPQSKERIIDLSYASFLKIGDLGQGILHNVKVEQILN